MPSDVVRYLYTNFGLLAGVATRLGTRRCAEKRAADARRRTAITAPVDAALPSSVVEASIRFGRLLSPACPTRVQRAHVLPREFLELFRKAMLPRVR